MGCLFANTFPKWKNVEGRKAEEKNLAKSFYSRKNCNLRNGVMVEEDKKKTSHIQQNGKNEILTLKD